MGEGVVGEMPLIAPGASFDYVSGCPLDTPSGAMSGSYRMVDEDGTRVRRRDPALSAAQRLTEPATARTIVLSANSDWNIANFRQGLVRALRTAGYRASGDRAPATWRPTRECANSRSSESRSRSTGPV